MAEIFFFGTLLVVFRFHEQYTNEMQKLLHLTPVLSVFVALIIAVVLGAVGGAIGGAFHRMEAIRGVDGLLGVFVHVAVSLVVIYLALSALVTLDNAFEPALRTANLTVAYAQGRRDAQPQSQNKSHARRVSDSYADEVT